MGALALGCMAAKVGGENLFLPNWGANLSQVDTEPLLQHVEELAKKHFSIDSLRPQQREVFTALANNKQVLAMLPTGAGKTLIYALGCLLFPEGVTIVVCPLIALMRDQFNRMSAAGINAAIIYSDQPEEERRIAFKNLISGHTRLLFVSPERFAMQSFQKLLKRLQLGMAVIDEAHCVVSWGHSFRPEYSQLAGLLRNLNPHRVLALTATASTASRELIRETVFPDHKQVYEVIDKPLRDNIQVEALRVYSEDERWESVKRLLKETSSRKSILYFPRREQCQKAAAELKRAGYNSVVYHAGLHKDFRRSVEEYLRQSERPVVICATLAFGMGIDLPNVELIVVVGFPGNIEEMFQMMGRAGRQGEKARAVVVWSGSDPKKRSFQFDKTLPEVHVVLERLQSISHFFPGRNQSRLVAKKEVSNALRALVKDGRDMDQCMESLAGVLSMFGAGGQVHPSRGDWITLEFKSVERLQDLLTELPSGKSRRRIVLEFLQQRFGKNDDDVGRRYALIPLGETLEELQMPWEKIHEVLNFYQMKAELRFGLLRSDEASEHLLLSGRQSDLNSALPRYTRWRNTLSRSLGALSSFVVAENCRMSGAEAFFLGKARGGGAALKQKCGRCDLCLSGRTGVPKRSFGLHAGTMTEGLPNHLR